MSHHSSDLSLTHLLSNTAGTTEELGNMLKDELAMLKEKQLQTSLGPTGDHPHGRIVPHDEGGLMFGVTVFNGRVIFDFGKPIRSIGFTREGALELAELIKRRAEQCPSILFAKKG
ncbi:hypothetical protein [Methylorubrum zatmanii]